MAKKRGKSKGKKKHTSKSKGLAGLPVALHDNIQKLPGHIGHLNTGIAIGSALGGVALGSLLFPKWSPWAGVGMIVLGGVAGNAYVTNFGIGCALSPSAGFAGTSGVDEEVDGISMELIKNRAKTLADTFKNKFAFPKKQEEQASTETNGLGATTYFVNPMELDMSALDKVSQEIAQMNGLYDIDPLDRNF